MLIVDEALSYDNYTKFESSMHKLDLYAESGRSVLKDILNKIFWKWFETNLNRKLTTIRFWFFKKSIYVKDLREIFTLLFGPQPNGLPEGNIS